MSVQPAVREVALEQDRVRTGLGDSLVQLAVGVSGQGDQAEAGMILAQPRDRGDAVDDRHVQVDHDRVRLEPVGELDRVEPVARDTCDRQRRLVLDQGTQRGDEVRVVVREQDANRCRRRPVRLVHESGR